MRRSTASSRLVPLVALAALASAGCSLRRSPESTMTEARVEKSARQAPAPHPPLVARLLDKAHPPPIEHVLDEDAERRNDELRKRWIEEMHRAPPGTSWRAVERGNGENLMRARARALLAKDYAQDTWTERGSQNMAGRMHCVAASLDGTTLYGGSSRGGVWRGGLDGSAWTPLGDNLWGGCHAIAVTQATGGEAILALTDWGRLRYTLDQGGTWRTPGGLPADMNAGMRLLNDPTNRARVLLLLGRQTGDRDVYRSEDGGATWALQRGLGSSPCDIWLDRIAGGDLYVLDGTELWIDDLAGGYALQGQVTTSPTDGAILAGSEAGAPTLYAAVRAAGTWELHRSDDAGANWTRQSDIGDFWGTLCASITDRMMIVTGGVEVFKSTDGGAVFSVINPWWHYYGDMANKLHADVPGLFALQLGGLETWYVGTDGGLFRSDDLLGTVHNVSLTGLRVSQYYTTHTSKLNPLRILAGAQDQGYQRSDGGTGPLDYEQLISGDYGHLTSTDRTHDWVYSVYPGFVLVHHFEISPELRQLDFPTGANMQWMPFVLANPANKESFYLCADHLWRYDRQPIGDTWNPVLDSPQDFTVAGGYTLTALSISPVNPLRRIAVTDAGVIWHTADGGANWIQSASMAPPAHYFYGTAIAHSQSDPLVAYVGGSGYGGPAVYRTTDGGVNWTATGVGLPSTLVYGLAWQAPDLDVVFAATEAGPYRLDPVTLVWQYIGGTVAPLTTYWSVESVPEVGVIRFGTYGRGIWDWQARVVPEAGNCVDGVDNEGDGLADCADPDCSADPACDEVCVGGVDEDLDGAVDCADTECVGQPGCVEICDSGFDEDLDGDFDCADSDCTGVPECQEGCVGGLDEDLDGLIDCEDPDCSSSPFCVEDCDNRVDDDSDGDVDCADADCAGDPACIEDCLNGLDDDADGDVDCADADCLLADSDSDAHVDCSDCAPLDSGAWASPGQVTDLRVRKTTPGGAVARLTWSASARTAAGPSTVHDVAAGSLAVLRAGDWPSAGSCLGSNLPGLGADDARPGITREWYLVRAENACASGTWGTGSLGTPADPRPGCP